MPAHAADECPLGKDFLPSSSLSCLLKGYEHATKEIFGLLPGANLADHVPFASGQKVRPQTSCNGSPLRRDIKGHAGLTYQLYS
jgi:hypothetical protein